MTKTITKGKVELLKKSSNQYRTAATLEFNNCKNIQISIAPGEEFIEFEYSYTDADAIVHSKRITSNCEFIVTENLV